MTENVWGDRCQCIVWPPFRPRMLLLVQEEGWAWVQWWPTKGLKTSSFLTRAIWTFIEPFTVIKISKPCSSSPRKFEELIFSEKYNRAFLLSFQKLAQVLFDLKPFIQETLQQKLNKSDDYTAFWYEMCVQNNSFLFHMTEFYKSCSF